METDLLRDDRFWRWCFESIAVRSAMSSQMACTRRFIARIASYRGLCTSSARWTCSIECGSRADVTLASASRNNPFSLPHFARREWRITFWTYLSLCARWLACGTVSFCLLPVRGPIPGRFPIYGHAICYSTSEAFIIPARCNREDTLFFSVRRVASRSCPITSILGVQGLCLAFGSGTQI